MGLLNCCAAATSVISSWVPYILASFVEILPQRWHTQELLTAFECRGF